MLNIESILPVSVQEETANITISQHRYDEFIEKVAQLESIKNMAMLHDVVRSDLILAVCGAVQEDEI